MSGFSFKIESALTSRKSGWLSADRVFTAPELHQRYDSVEISLFTPKCTLVPRHFFSRPGMRSLLSGVVGLDDRDMVDYAEIPEYGAVLIFSNTIGESLSKVISDTVLMADGYSVPVLPEMLYMIRSLEKIGEYNKVVASFCDGRLYLVIAQGKTLLLCNSFQASDFVSAQYFIFMCMKRLQLNPEVTVIHFRTVLSHEEEMSLYRYFKAVDTI